MSTAHRRLWPRAIPKKPDPSRPEIPRAAPPRRRPRFNRRRRPIEQTPSTPLCACNATDASYQCFATIRSGVDETNGRYADVRIDRCVACQRLWLRYFVEYESFSRSGRWARGLISETEAQAIAPEDAVDHLARLPNYLYGGSYFDGQAGVRTGRMNWDG